ncbi:MULTISPECIES: hypothetical protein [unclassified Isoptericola]|uniref:hypothetical protein n=1 Tax=unclassified Isoptericola TaxID=2623355 RepID=UPI0036575597
MGPFAVSTSLPRSPHAADAGVARLGALIAPPPRGAGPLVRPHDVGGRAAWHVLVRDGALEVLRGDAAVAAGTPVPPALRAALLAAELPTGGVLAGRSAAWVHAGRPAAAEAADCLDVTYPAGGHRPEVWGAGLVWQAPLLRGDTQELGRVRVTTPLRTVVDVALHVPGDGTAAGLARVLADACGLDLDDAARLLERRARAVGRPRARAVLDLARSGPPAVLRAAPVGLP